MSLAPQVAEGRLLRGCTEEEWTEEGMNPVEKETMGGGMRACPGSVEWPRQRRNAERLAAGLSRSQQGAIVDSGASCVPSRQGSAMRTRQPARHITATACCPTFVSGAHMPGHGGHRQGHCRASGDGTEPVPSLTAAGTEAHGGKMTGAARQGQHGE